MSSAAAQWDIKRQLNKRNLSCTSLSPTLLQDLSEFLCMYHGVGGVQQGARVDYICDHVLESQQSDGE